MTPSYNVISVVGKKGTRVLLTLDLTNNHVLKFNLNDPMLVDF